MSKKGTTTVLCFACGGVVRTAPSQSPFDIIMDEGEHDDWLTCVSRLRERIEKLEEMIAR